MLVAGTVASALATWFLFIYGEQPLIEDSAGYFNLGLTISQSGLSDFTMAARGRRTYGYPLVISAVVNVFGSDPPTVQAWMAVVQWVALVAASALFAWRVSQVTGLKRYGPLVYLACLSHPCVLAAVGTVLTDAVSASLLLAATAFVLPVGAGLPTRWSPALSALLVATATIVRPANLIVLLALPVIWGVRSWLLRDVPVRSLLLAILVVGLPFLPQMFANSRATGVAHPMLTNDLYTNVTADTMTQLKYGTLAIEGIPPKLRYFNPLAPADAASSADVLRDAPAVYALTVLLHLFALLDQDFLFTYVTVLHPPYRIPLAIFHQTFMLVMAWGFLVGLRTATTRRLRFTFGALLALMAAYVTVYLPTIPENRFVLPVLLIGTPGVCIGLCDIANRLRPPRHRTVGYVLAAWLALLAGGLGMQQWMRDQAPVLRGEVPPAAGLVRVIETGRDGERILDTEKPMVGQTQSR